MKYLTAVLLSLLLSTNGHADTTLEYTTAGKPPGNTLTYYVKGNLLRFRDGAAPRFNLFNADQQYFISAETESGTIARIDKRLIDKQVEKLSQQRLARVAEEEQQLRELVKDMDQQKIDIAESLINQLKYPEFYGAHTLLKVKPMKQTKTINGIACHQYQVTRKEQPVRQFCMASRNDLGLDENDYRTLRSFLHFNYQTQTRLLIAQAKTSFNHIDYKEQQIPGIPLEIIDYKEQQPVPTLSFKTISDKLLDASLFENPVAQK